MTLFLRQDAAAAVVEAQTQAAEVAAKNKRLDQANREMKMLVVTMQVPTVVLCLACLLSNIASVGGEPINHARLGFPLHFRGA